MTKSRKWGLQRRAAAVAFGLVVQLGFCSGTLAVCTGDCDGDGRVAVNELIIGVNVALDRLPMESCETIDRAADGRAGIDDLVDAVGNVLDGCPIGSPTATPTTPEPTETRTATVTLVMLSPTGTAAATPSRTTQPPTETRTAQPVTPTETVALFTSSPTDTPLATPSPSRTPTATPSATHVPTAAPQFRDVSLDTQAAMRLAVSSFGHLALLHDLIALSQGESCPGGGSAAPSCEPSTEVFVRTVVFENCRSSMPEGHTVERNGIVRRTVPDCQSAFGGENESFNLELKGFHLVEKMNDETVLSVDANLSVQITTGVERCAGLDARERLDGTLALTCTGEAASLACPEEGTDLALEATNLLLDRNSAGSPCERFTNAQGGLWVENRLSGEDFGELFNDFTLGLTPDALDPGEGDLVSVDGRMDVDCVGTMQLTTTRPLRIPKGSSCPIDGELKLGRPAGARASSLVAEHAITLAPLATPGSGFRQFLFRAVDGKVYQVIQNDDTANNADAIQLTTLVGSLGDSVATCTNTVGAQTNPLAAAVVPGGSAFPVAQVTRSGVIGAATLPCFNRNAEAGSGRVCIGADCTPDCGCPPSASCTAFTLGAGTVLGEADPAASLTEVNVACGSFATRNAYALGTDEPTTELSLCAPAPSDGLQLSVGSTVIVAYDTLPLELFNAGVAGLPIDLNGDSSLCPHGPGVLSPGRAESDTAAAPIIEFRADSSASADYDGDGTSDQIFPGCTSAVRIECNEPKNPTPTPTVDPSRPCGATVLDNANTIDLQGSTAGRANRAGEASCGWGGGSRGPDHAYEYVAPVDGFYEIRVEATGFSPYLYVRDGSCAPEKEELACDDDAGGQQFAEVTVQLNLGQTIAIVVDGADSSGGSFHLMLRRQQPDLVVSSVSFAPQAPVAAGSSLTTVSAMIINQGDGEAGPFAVDFFLARDAAGTEPVGAVPVRFFVTEGLAAGALRMVTLPNSFPIPLVAPQGLFLVTRADSFSVIAESNQANNATGVSIAIGAAPGAVLEQHSFRAEGGTVYQLMQARPITNPLTEPGAARQFRITTIAGSSGTVETCKTQSTGAGTPVGAAVATADLVNLTAVRRSEILRPNVFAAPRLDAVGSGMLRLGAGVDTIEVCADESHCTAAPLVPLAQAGGGLPAACAARLENGSYCAGVEAPATIAFGVASTAGVCDSPTDVSVQKTTCIGPATIRGFDLLPGEAVVFVHEPGREMFEVGSAAFSFAPSATNPGSCGAGQASDAQVARTQLAQAPVLAFRQAVRKGGVDGLTGAQNITVSSDGAHVYVASDSPGAVAVFSRDAATGTLTFHQVVRQGEGGVAGLTGAQSVTVSPDGGHVYVASTSGAVGVFSRDAATGTLGFEQVVRQGEGGVDGLDNARSVTVSPDGAQVYVASASGAVAVFSRDAGTGTLGYEQVLRQGEGGVDGLEGAESVMVSPDGAHLYVASSGFSGAVAVFSRDAGTGTLGFEQVLRQGEGGVDGLDFPKSLTVSPDGAHVYVVSSPGAMAVFSRDAGTGRLGFEQVLRQGEGGVDGLGSFPQSVTVSPDGAHVYVASPGAVVVFSRDTLTGRLAFEHLVRQGEGGVDGLQFARSVTVSPDGADVYVASASGAVAVLSRNGATGALGFERVVRQGEGGVDGLANAFSVTVSPDGAHVYVASDSGAVTALSRDTANGTVDLEQVVRQGEGGVDGLEFAQSVTVSPDGLHVYVASASGAVGVFSRDAATGTLGFEQVVRQGEGGVDGLDNAGSVTASPDGLHVYVASASGAVGVFSRDAGTGALGFEQVVRQGEGDVDGLEGARSVTASPDGAHVYVASDRPDAVAVFSRDGASGRLGFEQVVRQGEGGVDGLNGTRSVTVSPDGAHVYVASNSPGEVAVFSRDGASGRLGFEQVMRQGEGGIDGLTGAQNITVSSDGARVYVASNSPGAVAVFSRDAATGTLTFHQVVRQGEGGVDGLTGAQSVTVSPNGAHVYVASNSGAVVVFAVTEIANPVAADSFAPDDTAERGADRLRGSDPYDRAAG